MSIMELSKDICYSGNTGNSLQKVPVILMEIRNKTRNISVYL